MIHLSTFLLLLILLYPTPSLQLSTPSPLSLSSSISSRYACGRFDPNPQSQNSTLSTIQSCLKDATRSPTGFNCQPSRFLLISNDADKKRAANFACGRNKDRILQVRHLDVRRNFLCPPPLTMSPPQPLTISPPPPLPLTV